ncbi:type II toxin-antitoxin system HigB family toxin [Bradyrhizobium sp.]|uniref:type II toxin-antitoxin system HigB family toxin n=1 Tax=Bradyrhizobium sp. TaxID=376 RepID=UPI0025C642B2|nr:type II toxin-antitoxin system HigB family toxin [Bradyrhizobium sp.]
MKIESWGKVRQFVAARRYRFPVALFLHIFPKNGTTIFHFLEIYASIRAMVVIGTDIVERFFAERAGHRGIDAARAQYRAWLAIAEASEWRTPQDVKRSHPKASILKGGRVVFNIKANDYRLIALVQYRDGVLMIRFFGDHDDYDKVDAETV